MYSVSLTFSLLTHFSTDHPVDLVFHGTLLGKDWPSSISSFFKWENWDQERWTGFPKNISLGQNQHKIVNGNKLVITYSGKRSMGFREREGSANFFSKGQKVNIFGFVGHTVFFTKLPSSTLVAGKQLHTRCKWMGVFQSILFIEAGGRPYVSSPPKLPPCSRTRLWSSVCNKLPSNLVTSNDDLLVVFLWWLTWSLSRDGWKAGLNQLFFLSTRSQGLAMASLQQGYRLLIWQLPRLEEPSIPIS